MPSQDILALIAILGHVVCISNTSIKSQNAVFCKVRWLSLIKKKKHVIFTRSLLFIFKFTIYKFVINITTIWTGFFLYRDWLKYIYYLIIVKFADEINTRNKVNVKWKQRSKANFKHIYFIVWFRIKFFFIKEILCSFSSVFLHCYFYLRHYHHQCLLLHLLLLLLNTNNKCSYAHIHAAWAWFY